MKPITLVGSPGGTSAAQIAWLTRGLRQLELASRENDVQQIATNFAITGTYSATRGLDVSTATLADLIAFVATFFADLQKGGANRNV